MTDKIAETLEKLERGEGPPCPWCGAAYDGATEGEAVTWHNWLCRSWMYTGTRKEDRHEYQSKSCELAALRAENERLLAIIEQTRNEMRNALCGKGDLGEAQAILGNCERALAERDLRCRLHPPVWDGRGRS